MGISPLVQPLRRRQNMKRTLLTWLVLVIGLSHSSALPHPGVEQSGAKEMHPLSKMEPLPCPTNGSLGLPKLMELGNGNYCSDFYYDCDNSEATVQECYIRIDQYGGSFDPVSKRCSETEVYCAMHKEDVIEWNKPCQTDYLVLISPYSNNARLQFCNPGAVFDPTKNQCEFLTKTECSQDVCDYYWPRVKSCKPFPTSLKPSDPTTHPTTHPSTHPTTHPTTDATTRPTTPTVLTTTVEPDDDFVCPNGGDDLFGRPGHCNQFYLCKDGYPAHIYLFNCPRGSEFDPSRKQCIPGAKFQC